MASTDKNDRDRGEGTRPGEQPGDDGCGSASESGADTTGLSAIGDNPGDGPFPAAGDAEPETPAGDRKKSRRAQRQEDAEAALKAQLLRLRADFDNFRKRTLREKNEIYCRANEDLMAELLPVLDHMDLAMEAAREHGAPDAVADGFAMVRDQLLGALLKFRLTPIDAAGATFDPARHEAISHLPSADVPELGVITQTRRGYKLGDRLLRPAQVVVSSGPPASGAGGENGDNRE